MNRRQLLGKVWRREWGRLLQRPIYALTVTLLPLCAALFFAILFGKGSIHHLPIALLDRDHSPLSRQLATMIDATPSAQIIRTIATPEEGFQRIRSGEIAAFVVLPEGFEARLSSNRPTVVESYISATNLTVNGLLAKEIQSAVATFSAGIQRAVLLRGGLNEQQAMAALMPVRFESHLLFNPYLNYGYYLTPCFLPMMLLIFVTMATTYALGSELREGSAAAWLDTAAGELGVALLGKCLPTTLLMSLQAVLILLILHLVIGVPWHGSVGIVAVATLLLILDYQAISILLIALTADLRLALSLGGGYSVLAFTFSGMTFPLMAMWPTVAPLGEGFPFTPYMRVVVDQLLRGAPPSASLEAMAQMGVFLLLPLLAGRRLKRISTDPRYWGRN